VSSLLENVMVFFVTLLLFCYCLCSCYFSSPVAALLAIHRKVMKHGTMKHDPIAPVKKKNILVIIVNNFKQI